MMRDFEYGKKANMAELSPAQQKFTAKMVVSDEAGKSRKQYLGLETPKYHEINDMIKIDFKIPEALRHLMEEAEKADIRHDGSYDNLADTIDVMSKNCYAAGKITAAQWDTIVRRYPQ